MSICIICGAPDPEEQKLRYFDLPTSMFCLWKTILVKHILSFNENTIQILFFLGTSNPEWHARFMNELGIIGESDQQLRNMKICEVSTYAMVIFTYFLIVF